MAGLNNIISNSATQSTTMPAWFDTAQQNVVSGAGTALGQAPAPQNTVAQNAVNALSGPTNAFTQATGTLQGIASGAANPWLTDSTTGKVTPNTNTALGGLFQAQNQQLQQTMPQYTAPVDASAIGSGNFGSLRGQTAYNKAMGDAQANLFAQQNQAALQNQQTGVQAGIGAGNVAQQDINNALTVGQYQQASPFANISNYGKVIGGVQSPTTVSNQTQLSPLNQIMGAINLLGGANGSGGALAQIFGSGTKGQSGYNPGLLGSIGNIINGKNTGSSIFDGIFGGGSGSGGQAISTDQATQDYLNQNPGATPRDDEGGLMPGWQYGDDDSVFWSGNTNSGGTDYIFGDEPDWSATESYD
jgi:hypothetical protein